VEKPAHTQQGWYRVIGKRYDVTLLPDGRVLTASGGLGCGAENPRLVVDATRAMDVRARRWEKVAAAVPPRLGAASKPSAPSPSTVMESIRPALASIRLSAPKRAYRPLYQCLHTSAARGATPLPHPSGTRHDVAKMAQQLTSDSTRTTACDARATAIRCI
jgi:hypothetical protein